MSNTIATLIASTEDSFIKKTSLDFGSEAHFAMQLLTAKNYTRDAALKNPASVKAAMINVAAIGLSLNPANKEAYLVPRDGAIHLDVSYTGLVKLATNTGSINWVQARVVYEADTFIDNGIGEKPEHTNSKPFADKGAAVGVYCVAKTIEGDYLTTMMSADEVEAVRETSKAKDSKYSPWNTFPAEMWKKVVIKRASKLWPKTDKAGSEALQEAIHVINEHEGNDFVEPVSKELQKYFDSLVDDENGLGLYCLDQSLEVEQRIQVQSDYVGRNAPPRGKGKMVASIEELKQSGRVEVEMYVKAFSEAADDESAVKELEDELSEDELSFIRNEIKLEEEQ